MNEVLSFERLARHGAVWGACILIAACSAANQDEVLAAARTHLDQGQADTAVIELKNLLQAHPHVGAARALLARALFVMGQVPGAELEYEHALSEGLAPVQVLPGLAETLVVLGKDRELLSAYGDTKLDVPLAEAALQFQLARASLTLGDGKQALARLERSLAADPGFAPAHVLQVRLLAGQAGALATRARIDDLVRKFPNSADVWVLQGDSQSDAAPDTARSAYQKALALDPAFVGAHAGLVLLDLQKHDYDRANEQVTALSQASPLEGAPTYLGALVAYSARKYALARELCQALMASPNPSPDVLLLAGMTERQLGAFAQAETWLVQARERRPDALGPKRELAILYLASDQPARAMESLNRLLSPSQNDALTWEVAARAYSMLGDFKSADQAFERAATLRPHDTQIRLDQGRTLLVRGQYDAGLRILDQTANEVKNTDADTALVAALMQREQFDAAERVIDKMAARNPKQPGIELLRGRVMETRRNEAAARNAYERALRIDAAYMPAIEALAVLDLRSGKVDAARARYQGMVDRDPKQVTALLALAQLTRQSAGGHAAAEALLDKAIAVDRGNSGPWLAALRQEQSSGDVQAFLTRAQQAALAFPQDSEVLCALGEAQTATGDNNQAIGTFGKAVRVRPNSLSARLLLAQSYLTANDSVRAGEEVAAAARIEPDSTAVLRARVRLALALNKPAEAEKLAVSYRNAHPELAVGWQLESEVEASQKNWPAAANSAHKALAVAPSSATAIAVLGYLELSGASAQREKFEHEWLGAHPRDAEFIANLARGARNRGDLPGAAALYRRALALNADAPLLHNNLAMVLLAQKDPDAVGEAQRAVQLAPEVAPLLDTLARAQAAAGQIDQAIDKQARAVEMSPHDGELRLELARLYIQAGKTAQAREQLERLLAHGDGLRSLDEVQQLLRGLGGAVKTN
ncbi:MAG: PEP-CTERM system TPR-repeat protein PrsT [Burkholderiaceae bacterium]|nr:PEP-CTERM system TPR-repeat protein PrsT [Roseateles sp.]MBV8468689.1 PEP-CTERM system TPR-repeat protein PrsT [Burkholderiaceae bacterium]